MCLAVPGAIVSIVNDAPLTRQAIASFGGLLKTISLVFLPEAQVGQYVLVHAGVAISVVDEAEALKTFEYLKEIDAIEMAEDAPP